MNKILLATRKHGWLPKKFFWLLAPKKVAGNQKKVLRGQLATQKCCWLLKKIPAASYLLKNFFRRALVKLCCFLLYGSDSCDCNGVVNGKQKFRGTYGRNCIWELRSHIICIGLKDICHVETNGFILFYALQLTNLRKCGGHGCSLPVCLQDTCGYDSRTGSEAVTSR